MLLAPQQLLLRRTVRFASALAFAGSLATAQGVIEPRHKWLGENINHWGYDSIYDGERTLDVVGDVNGDGFDDVVVSTPYSGPNGNRYGSVAVLSGLDGEVFWSAGGQNSGAMGWHLGWSVAGAGDVNADGVPDVIAGAPYADLGAGFAGRAFVYSGSDGTILHSLTGVDPNHRFGYSVSGIGDLNADGHDDVVVSGCLGGGSSGRVVVYSGANGTILRNWTSPENQIAENHFGYVVRDGGDIDGDGVHDVLVGNPRVRNSSNELTGAVYVFSGATGALVYTIHGTPTSGSSGFGKVVDGIGDQNGDGRDDFLVTGEQGYYIQVISGLDASVLWTSGLWLRASGAGDVNGDGIEDFLVGNPNATSGGTFYYGLARLIAGGSFTTLYTFTDNTVTYLGSNLSRSGDINADGFADFMVRAPNDDTVYVYLGRPVPKELRRVEGGSAGDRVGSAVSGAGDVDADGYDDVIVGAPNDDTAVGVDAGSARVLSGFDGRTLVTCQGVEAGDLLGFAVSAAGDVNRDGFDDVIVGAPLNDLDGLSAGEARLYSGRTGSELRRLAGPAAGAYFGYSVSDAGDVNGDGHADVIVGAPYEDVSGSIDAGSATVFSGADWTELHRWTGAAANDYFGRSVSSAGDVNGDGLDDLVVGAFGSDANGANSGSATVYSGFDGALLFIHHGTAAGDQLGFSVSGAGDVNKDGLDDVIVGAPDDHIHSVYGSGYARVLTGPTGAQLYQFDPGFLSSPYQHHRLGYSVSGAGDVNGDGHADVIVGVPHFTPPGSGSTGGARVHSGFDGGVLLYQFQGDSGQNIEFGNAVSAAGDVNGDGRDDVIVGAYLRDSGGLSDSGAAYIYSLGYPGETPKRRKGQAPPGPVIRFP